MTDQEYVLCMWKKRLWPAKVLYKTGVGGKTSVNNAKETSFKVEILGLTEQISVKCVDAVPLKEECIENIASRLDQRNNSSEAVEELKYRRSLKIALDILNQNVSPREVPPNTRLPQENSAGSLSSTPLRRCRSLCHSKEKLEPQTSRKKREQKNNPSLKTDTKTQTASFLLEERAKAHERGTNPSTCSTVDLNNTSNSGSQNCKTPESNSLPRQKKVKPELLTKSQIGNKVSLKKKSEQGGKRRRGAGSPVSHINHFPTDPAQPLAEEGSLLPVPREAGTEGPVRRTNTRRQPKRTLLDSSCKSASDDLEKSISSESESLAKQLGGRKQPVSVRRVNGQQEIGVTPSSYGKRKCRNCPESSSGPSNHETLSDGVPSQCEGEENKNTSHVIMSKVKLFQLPDFEEDEGLESSDLSPKIVSSESLSRLSALVDEEEEDEELPSILSHQEPQSIEEGILVWCKLRRYPYWPAVVKNVKRKLRKACVLFIEGNTNDKKKGFSVSLKSLKHFDCEEKQDLIERAKENYRQEIEWCIRLISDYRIRVGCHSFTGSFLEYFAADISYPVRKEGYQGLVPMTFPNMAEEDVEESSSETSPQKPSKKLLPDRTRAARDKANKKIVEFIVKTKGAEEHLLAILKSRKQSRWLKEFLNSSQYTNCVETYLEDEEQLDLVVNYLKEVYCEIGAKNLHQINGDAIKLISDVLLPERNESKREGAASFDCEPPCYSGPSRKLFVGGLDWSTTQETLRSYFSQYGEVVDCVIMKDKTTNQSRGFGFVKFKDPNCVGTVLASRPHTLDGRNIDPKPCTPRGMQPERTRPKEGWQKGSRSDNNKSNKIFVGGIPHNCGETELREYFKKFGVVTEVVMIYDAEKQRPRGFGFITFEDEQSVDQAVNMHFHDIMGKKVEVKRAEPRDSKSQTPGPPGASQWGSRIMPSAANGWAGQPPPTWQQGYGPQGMWVPAGQAIGGYGPPPPGRGAPPPPPPFTSYIVSTPPGGFPPPQGFPQGYGTPPPFSFGYGAPPPPPDQFAPPGVPPPPATPGAAPLAFPPPPPPSQATQDMSKPPTAQPEFPYSQFGYGQDLSGFGQGFSDPSQQPPPYGGPSVQPSSGPPAGGSGFGRGQNHNVQGFHPYRR